MFGIFSARRKETTPYEFSIGWFPVGDGTTHTIDHPLILLSDVPDMKYTEIEPVYQKCRTNRRALVLVAPCEAPQNSDISKSVEDVLHIKARDLPHQEMRGLLEDIAVVTGGRVFFRSLGFGLSFPETTSKRTPHGVFLPETTWRDVTLDDLGEAEELTASSLGLVLRWSSGRLKGPRSDVIRRIEHIANFTVDPEGRARRLERFAALGPVTPRREHDGLEANNRDWTTMPFCLACPYFVTDARTMRCDMKNPRLAIVDGELTDLDMCLSLLDLAAEKSFPLMFVAGAVSDQVLATCVVNKLRGIVQCAVLIPASKELDAHETIRLMAERTFASPIAPSYGNRPTIDALGVADHVSASSLSLLLR